MAVLSQAEVDAGIAAIVKTDLDATAPTTATSLAGKIITMEATLATIQADALEIKTHLNSAGRWFGASAGGASPGLLTSITPWVLTSGAIGVYGAAVEVLSGGEDCDLPFTPSFFEPHLINVTDVSDDGIYKVRIASSLWDGEDHTYATMADAITANKYTEFVRSFDSTRSPSTAIPLQTGITTKGSKLWMQVLDSNGTSTISVLVGVNSYA